MEGNDGGCHAGRKESFLAGERQRASHWKRKLIFSSPVGGKEKRNIVFIKCCLSVFPIPLKTRYCHPQFTGEKICNSPMDTWPLRGDRIDRR